MTSTHSNAATLEEMTARLRNMEARLARLEEKRRPVPLMNRMRGRAIAYIKKVAYKSAWELVWFIYVSKLRDLLVWGILRAYWMYSRWQRRSALAMERAIDYSRDWTR